MILQKLFVSPSAIPISFKLGAASKDEFSSTKILKNVLGSGRIGRSVPFLKLDIQGYWCWEGECRKGGGGGLPKKLTKWFRFRQNVLAKFIQLPTSHIMDKKVKPLQFVIDKIWRLNLYKKNF